MELVYVFDILDTCLAKKDGRGIRQKRNITVFICSVYLSICEKTDNNLDKATTNHFLLQSPFQCLSEKTSD